MINLLQSRSVVLSLSPHSMSYMRSNLPAELVLDIFNNIKNWQDRYQFALTSSHHWYCIIRSCSLREVQLNDEKNLLKIRIARSIVLSPGVQAERDISKAVRFLAACTKLKTVVITTSITATLQIEKILRAASQREGSIEIIVPAPIYAKWTSVLNNQKLKQDTVAILCELDNEEPSSSNSLYNGTDFLASVNYSNCSHIQQSAEYISSNVDSTANNVGNYFVGAVICFEKVKVLITSLDVFFHIENVDDCAYAIQWFNESVFAKLHMKSEKGNNFFELSIIVDGCIELLAVAGLCSINGGSVEPFLGSSVKPLNRAKVLDGDITTTKILVPTREKETMQSERLLRQYYKRDSCKLWSYHLKGTYDVGFYPVHPLHAEQHPSSMKIQLILQSRLLNMYATRKVSQEVLANSLQAIVNSDMLIMQLKLHAFHGNSFRQLFEAMTVGGKWSDIIRIAAELESGVVRFGDDKKCITKNKKSVLQLVNSGYLSTLSRMNDKNCAVFKNKISK